MFGLLKRDNPGLGFAYFPGFLTRGVAVLRTQIVPMINNWTKVVIVTIAKPRPMTMSSRCHAGRSRIRTSRIYAGPMGNAWLENHCPHLN